MAAFRQQVQAYIDQNLSPAARSQILADTARKGLAELIAAGKAPPTYDTYVDGRKGADESTVIGTGGGRILYLFSSQAQAVVFALAFLRTRSPDKTGRYRDSFWIGVDGTFSLAGSFDPASVPPGADITIVNTAPYARKVEVGHMRMSVPHNVMEDARQAVKRKFPLTKVEKTFVWAPASIGGGYVLHGRFHAGFRPHARQRLYSDTTKGSDMTYPAIIISAVA